MLYHIYLTSLPFNNNNLDTYFTNSKCFWPKIMNQNFLHKLKMINRKHLADHQTQVWKCNEIYCSIGYFQVNENQINMILWTVFAPWWMSHLLIPNSESHDHFHLHFFCFRNHFRKVSKIGQLESYLSNGKGIFL